MSADSESCFHCGAPVPPGEAVQQELLGAPRVFCCLGCRSVAAVIAAGGLEGYYRQRATPGARPEPEQAHFPATWFDRPDLLQTSVTRAQSGGVQVLLSVEDIRCGACAWLIEQHLGRQSGVLQVQANVSTRRVLLRWDQAHCTLGTLVQALRDIGYDAWPTDPQREARGEQQRQAALWRRLFVAGFGSMQVMMYAFPQYVARSGDMDPATRQLLHGASLVLTLPVVLYSAQPFFQGAWRGLRARHPGMDLTVALGILIAFGASVVNTLQARGEVYFDSVSMFVFFLLGGRYLEQKARQRARQAAEHRVRPMPALAHRLAGHAVETVPATALQPGDRIRIQPGEIIPVDARVQQGSARVDESLLTGEAMARDKGPGDPLVGGTLNQQGVLWAEVTAVGAHTVQAGIQRLMEQSLQEKPPVALLADRIAGSFVQGLLLLALLTALYWAAHDPARILPAVIALLVVSCPCALSLATPAAVAAATTAAMQAGVLITRGHVLETLARATHVVFDKTGTLTRGEMTLSALDVLGPVSRHQCLHWAACLEAGSEHVLARALRLAAGPEEAAQAVLARHYPGLGMEAEVEGQLLRLGQAGFMWVTVQREHLDLTPGLGTEVWLGTPQQLLARFLFVDRVRPEVPELLRFLRAQHLGVSILSGDRPEVVEDLARQLGVEQAAGACSAAQKLEAVQALQRRGEIVVMVGDGLNDTPGLARAQVSIALGRATDVVQNCADVVLLGTDLGAVQPLLQQARRTLVIVRQNLAWALGYNLLAIPLAAAGLVTPWLAGLGMSCSSLLVVTNALRLSRPWKSSISSSPSA